MTPKSPIRPLAALLVSGVVWVTGSMSVEATTMRRMDLPEVVNRAERIVHAVAVEERVYWDNEYRKIFTDTTFEVIEDLKVPGPPRLTVTLLGGNINGFDMRVEGTPTFHAGDEVILFTSPRPEGNNHLVGFSQGVMNVVEDPENGRKLVRSFMPTGVTYIDNVGGRPGKVNRSPRVAPLRELKDEIQRLVEANQPRPLIEKKDQSAEGED